MHIQTRMYMRKKINVLHEKVCKAVSSPPAGDFDIPSSREDVDRDSPWNQWLRSEIPLLFLQAMDVFRVSTEQHRKRLWTVTYTVCART